MRIKAMVVVCLVGLTIGPAARAEEDSWEGFNRAMFSFNEGVDRWVFEPLARGWDFILPDPVQTGVSNFAQNVQTPWIAVNQLLQGKPLECASDMGRFVLNTTVGGAGFFDPADEVFGLDRHEEDFGQTLGRWGVPSGPYVVWPIMGPSTVRDTGGLIADSAASAYGYFMPVYGTIGYWTLNAVNARSRVLTEVDNARGASLDFYAAVRNAYLTRRDRLVRDEKETTRDIDDSLYYPDSDAP